MIGAADGSEDGVVLAITCGAELGSANGTELGDMVGGAAVGDGEKTLRLHWSVAPSGGPPVMLVVP